MRDTFTSSNYRKSETVVAQSRGLSRPSYELLLRTGWRDKLIDSVNGSIPCEWRLYVSRALPVYKNIYHRRSRLCIISLASRARNTRPMYKRFTYLSWPQANWSWNMLWIFHGKDRSLAFPLLFSSLLSPASSHRFLPGRIPLEIPTKGVTPAASILV